MKVEKQNAIEGYKAFNADWTCRDKQYGVGKTYHEDRVVICAHGMHFCKDLINCFLYYDFNHEFHVAKVRGWGTIEAKDEDTKVCASDLEIISEVKGWQSDEKVQLAAVKQDGLAIGYMDNPSEKVQLVAKGN